MKDLTDRSLNRAQLLGASYADIRIVRRHTQVITVKNGRVEALSLDEDQGFGVRAIVDGAWGFAAGSCIESAEVDRVTAQAVKIARSSSIVKVRDVNIGPPEVHVGTYRTPVEIDPFGVSLEDKISLLLAADEAMRKVKGLAVAEGSLEFIREQKVFASTEGSYVEQEIIEWRGARGHSRW